MFSFLVICFALSVHAAHACPRRCDCAVVDSEMVVYCRRQKLTQIPAGIPADTVKLILGFNPIASLDNASFPPLPRLRSLELNNCQLVRLGARAFAALPALKELQLHDNRLEALHADTFAGLPSLRQLDLSRNNLTTLAGGVFAGLRLAELLLSHNQLGELSDDVFGGASVAVLAADHNALAALTVAALRPLAASLRRLSVSHGARALTVEPGVFAGFRLHHLTLADDHIVNTAFIQTLVVTSLDLSANPLSAFALHFETLSNLAHVQHLRLRAVGADRIRPALFTNMRALRSLDLTANVLTGVDGRLFAVTPNLTVLHLAQNRLVAMPTDTGDTLRRLEQLHLSENLISVIRHDHLAGLVRLRLLDLRHNRLQVLGESLRGAFTVIAELYLTGNPLHCNCQMRWFRRWMDTYRSYTGAEDCRSPDRAGEHSYIWDWREDEFVCTSPAIVDVTSDVIVTRGDRLSLSCNAHADPAPEVTWTHPSGNVMRTQAASNRSISMTRAILAIAAVDVSDGGVYTCTARNLMDTTSRTMIVHVRSVPYAATTTVVKATTPPTSSGPDSDLVTGSESGSFKTRTMIIISVGLSLLVFVATGGFLLGSPFGARQLRVARVD